jgi:phosphatidylglycerophosphate synthase
LRYSRRYNDVASTAHMTGLAWRLPDAPLRSSVARAGVIALIGAAGLTVIVNSWTGTSSGYAARSLGLFAVMALFVAGFVGAYHPFPRFGLANQVTLFRLVLVAAVAAFVGEPRAVRIEWIVVALTTVVVALDGLDGWLARRSRTTSTFGARFDMETDALLIMVLSLLVWQRGKAGAWVLGCGLMRYAFVACGSVLPWMAGPLRSTFRGKSVAIAQLVGLGVALSPLVPPPYSDAVAVITLVALAWSFAVDVVWLFRTSR